MIKTHHSGESPGFERIVVFLAAIAGLLPFLASFIHNSANCRCVPLFSFPASARNKLINPNGAPVTFTLLFLTSPLHTSQCPRQASRGYNPPSPKALAMGIRRHSRPESCAYSTTVRSFCKPTLS